MCCTKFEDNNWYRALVIGKDFDNAVSVPVYYIDYGNVSTVKVSRYIRKLIWLSFYFYFIRLLFVHCRIIFIFYL